MSRSSKTGNAATRTRRTLDGGGPGRTSNGQPTRPRGRPFEKGNQLAKRRRTPMSEDELRRVLRSSITKRGLRSLVKRLEQVVREGSGRDAVAASRLLLNLAGLTGVDEGVLRGRTGGATLAPPQGAVISIDEMLPEEIPGAV